VKVQVLSSTPNCRTITDYQKLFKAMFLQGFFVPAISYRCLSLSMIGVKMEREWSVSGARFGCFLQKILPGPSYAIRPQGIGHAHQVDKVPPRIALLPPACVGIVEVTIESMASHLVIAVVVSAHRNRSTLAP
jgi:hypothetical protein